MYAVEAATGRVTEPIQGSLIRTWDQDNVTSKGGNR